MPCIKHYGVANVHPICLPAQYHTSLITGVGLVSNFRIIDRAKLPSLARCLRAEQGQVSN